MSDFFTASPFSLMRRLSDEMDRFFSDVPTASQMQQPGSWLPAIEVSRHGNDLVVCAELPGMGKDDVKVECTDQGLVIEGEKKRETEHEEGEFLRSERMYGSFYRLIPLPEGADVEKARASFKDGILQVEVPLSESRPQARRIEIAG